MRTTKFTAFIIHQFPILNAVKCNTSSGMGKKSKCVWNPVQINKTWIKIINWVLRDKLIHAILEWTEKQQNKHNWEVQMKIINQQLTKTVWPDTSWFLDFWTDKKETDVRICTSFSENYFSHTIKPWKRKYFEYFFKDTCSDHKPLTFSIRKSNSRN